ncbi:MAG: hypothetical protein ABFD63_01205 [Smithella sp.]
MQAYDLDGRIFETMTGNREELRKRSDYLLERKLASKVVIDSLPRAGTEVVINNLVFIVTNTNQFGKVILMLKKQ